MRVLLHTCPSTVNTGMGTAELELEEEECEEELDEEECEEELDEEECEEELDDEECEDELDDDEECDDDELDECELELDETLYFAKFPGHRYPTGHSRHAPLSK